MEDSVTVRYKKNKTTNINGIQYFIENQLLNNTFSEENISKKSNKIEHYYGFTTIDYSNEDLLNEFFDICKMENAENPFIELYFDSVGEELYITKHKGKLSFFETKEELDYFLVKSEGDYKVEYKKQTYINTLTIKLWCTKKRDKEVTEMFELAINNRLDDFYQEFSKQKGIHGNGG